jgi:hypothetical protein
LAGYNFNNSADDSVAGSLIIDDYASISASNGTDGIRGFNYGIGDITIAAEAGATISGGRYGIAAIGHDGGEAHINNSATVSGASAAIFAQTTGTGAITIVNSTTGVVESSGNASSPAISIADDPTGSGVITNFGTIEAFQNSAASLAILEVGGVLTINNSAQIIGDVNLSNAIFNNNAGADWEIAGTNTFASGINIINNAGTINSQGSLTTIQITAGSLDIVGAINGTVNLAVGNGATLELNGPSSSGESVTFLGTQGTLKLDQSLTSPFLGPISNLDATSLAHDNIDLADLAWTAASSAQYVSATATSGTLTVNDGVGHTEVFSLVNYTGAGIFFAQNDGQGGTLVFDPPDAAVSSSIELPAFVPTRAEAAFTGFASGVSLTSESQSSSSLASDRAGNVENASANLDYNLSHLASGQMAPERFPTLGQPATPQGLPQAQQLNLPGTQSSHVATQEASLLGAGDTFQFKLTMGAATQARILDHAVSNVDLEHAVGANLTALQALISPDQIAHDPSLILGHAFDPIAHVPPGLLHAEGFMFS